MSGLPNAQQLLTCGVLLARTNVTAAKGVDPRKPTPCSQWDLSELIRHLADSARSLRELLLETRSSSTPRPGCDAALSELDELADAITDAAFTTPGRGLIALTGAYELSLHAWDISEATNQPADFPEALLAGLLVYAPHVISGISRTDLFSDPVPLRETAKDLDRLLALFGRRRQAKPAIMFQPTHTNGDQP